MTKEEQKQKDTLKRLAKEIGFESVMFADIFGFSKKEDTRYYLWQRELELWLINKFPKHFMICSDQKLLSEQLIIRIQSIKHLI